MPEEARTELNAIVDVIAATAVVPAQVLAAMAALIPKSPVGVIPICLMNMSYRWMLKAMRGDIKKWDAEQAGP